MNKKYYASEHQRGAAINRSWRNDTSDKDNFDSWEHERDYSNSLMRRRYRSTTLDDIDKVNRYIEVLYNSEEYEDRSEHMKTTRRKERPQTPPPPVISFHTDRKKRTETENVFKYMDPITSKKIRRNSMHWSPPSSRNISFGNYTDTDPSGSRKLRRQSNGIDLTECALSPLELALNRGSSSYMNRWSPGEKDFEEMHYSHRNDRRENERSAFMNPLSSPESSPAKNPKDLILTIIDEGPNYNRLGQMKWRLVESALCMIYLDIMREYPGPPPMCRDAGWFLGCAKLIECADERSLKLYKHAICRLGEVWPGARLKIVNRNEITTSAMRVRCSTFVSAEPSDKQAILECIQFSNPDLPTSDWRVISVGAPSRLTNERHIIISFGIESLPIIEQRRGVIKYSFESITLKINKRDKNLSQRVTGKGNSYLEDLDDRTSSRRRRRWSELDDDDDDNAIILSDSEEDEGSDYS